MTIRILIVDDESSIREALSKVLKAEDYQVECAGSEEEAFAIFATVKIDLLLLDLGLPVKNGWATLAWLHWVNPLLPIVIITGQSNQCKLAEAAGADGLIEKPLNVPRLLQTVRDLVGEPIETRALTPHHREPGFRYVPCDSQSLPESLKNRPRTRSELN